MPQEKELLKGNNTMSGIRKTLTKEMRYLSFQASEKERLEIESQTQAEIDKLDEIGDRELSKDDHGFIQKLHQEISSEQE